MSEPHRLCLFGIEFIICTVEYVLCVSEKTYKGVTRSRHQTKTQVRRGKLEAYVEEA